MTPEPPELTAARIRCEQSIQRIRESLQRREQIMGALLLQSILDRETENEPRNASV